MKKFTFLLTLAIIFASCASEGTDTTSATTPTVQTNGVAKEVSNVLNNTKTNISESTDGIVPSDTKIDETVDKVADKLKGVLKKGKKDVAEEIKKTKENISEAKENISKKADKAVENISSKSKEIGSQIETKIDKATAQVEEKIDKVTASTPAPVAAVIPAKTTPAAAPKKEVKKTTTNDVVTKKVWGKDDKPNHDYFNSLLKKHVTGDGTVNYKGFKADDHLLEDYLSQLKNNPIHPDWSRGEKLAYWINAYNAFTIKLIVDNYPVKSIQDINGGKPWAKKWIKLGDKTYSLNQIENDIIRPQFKEPRIHFAVNCAAKSCPPLSNTAWTASNLESKFESATKTFVNNSSHNSIDNKSATISKIFEWYKEDFGDLTTYLNKYSATSLNKGGKIKFKEYDWSLNE